MEKLIMLDKLKAGDRILYRYPYRWSSPIYEATVSEIAGEYIKLRYPSDAEFWEHDSEISVFKILPPHEEEK